MELTKFKDIIDYKGRIYVIRPYIEEGKIKRNTIFTRIKEPIHYDSSKRCYSLGRVGTLCWYYTTFHTFSADNEPNEDTIASEVERRRIRIFTDRESAKKALEEYVKQNIYNLNDSIDKELKCLEEERKKINEKIKKLKDKKKECFEKLTTTFSKKS